MSHQRDELGLPPLRGAVRPHGAHRPHKLVHAHFQAITLVLVWDVFFEFLVGIVDDDFDACKHVFEELLIGHRRIVFLLFLDEVGCVVRATGRWWVGLQRPGTAGNNWTRRRRVG